MVRRYRCYFLAVFWAFMPGLLHAQASTDTGNAEREVRALQRDWMDAMTRGDRAALDRIIGENFTFIHSTGGMEGKKEYIDRAAAGAQLFQRSEITVEGEQLHLYEDRTAVWTSRVTMRNKTDHTETNLQSTNVYVKSNGRWHWVAGQSTRLPTRPEPATINRGVLKTYAGQYAIAAGRSLTVTEDGGTLRAVVTGYRPAELVPKTETEFVWFNPEMNVYSEVVFVRDSSGQVTQAVFQREGVEVWRGKKVK